VCGAETVPHQCSIGKSLRIKQAKGRKRCLRFSKLVTGMHFDGPVANCRANGQLFHGDADDGARALGLLGIDYTALALFEELR
jgi:hypothetical protein